jgi:catechol 2,3-dioxygenase-like lactoylglutathione lyase family enzyme
MGAAHFVLFVTDPSRASAFWRATLGFAPRLDVPGMTEFELAPGAVLGLMPVAGVERLFQREIRPDPGSAHPVAELYLLVDDPAAAWARAVAAGGKAVSAIQPRPWGHEAGYLRDPDGHLFAVARPTPD